MIKGSKISMGIGAQPSGRRSDDDENDGDLESERPALSLKAAIAWIATRSPEIVTQVENEDWNEPLDESAFEFAASGSDAWSQLQHHLATGKISATGVPYLVPDGFDLSAGGWSAKGGGFHRKISPELFSGLEPVVHPLAPYSAVRPYGVIFTGAKWYRDLHIDAADLQISFPRKVSNEQEAPKKRRNREALKKDAAARAYQDLFPTPESRQGKKQPDRLKLLNATLKHQPISMTLFKLVEKEAKRGLKRLNSA
jgi:hypothetical protein